MPEKIRDLLDLSYTPTWAQILQEFILPLLFLLWCVAMIGGPA